MSELFTQLMGIMMAVLALSLALAMLRLLLGPSIPDRAMAFDVIYVHVAGLIALFVILVGQKALLDAIIIVSALGFLGTVTIAHYIDKGLR